VAYYVPACLLIEKVKQETRGDNTNNIETVARRANMAFEQVILRTADGKEYGPVPLWTMRQWQQEGRVPADAVLIDAATWETRPAAVVLAGPVMPPPMTGAPTSAAPSATDHLIPTKNPKALIAYYTGVFSLIPCIWIIGIAALILGIMGLRDARTLGVGRTHAIVGIVLGSLEILLTLAGITAIVIGAVNS